MVNVLYRTPTELNGVGCEMKIIEMEGDRMIEVVSLPKRTIREKLKMMYHILMNKPVVCGSVLMDDTLKVEVNHE